jgi:hypothetical protein
MDEKNDIPDLIQLDDTIVIGDYKEPFSGQIDLIGR